MQSRFWGTLLFLAALSFANISLAQARRTQPAVPVAPSAPYLVQLPDFSPLVENVGNTVVHISVTYPIVQAPNPGDFGGQKPRGALGTGFIVSQNGYIITNAHVIADAEIITVRFTDNRELPANLVGKDERSDIALIKVDAQNLPVVRIGDPDLLKVGHWVVAIGSPFGLMNTVTAGIVSAKERTMSDTGFGFIQSDVAINPGNSGGPLFNLRGEVVGINSNIISRSGGSVGISLAIPIDVAMNVKAGLQASGRMAWGRIGITLEAMTPKLAQSLGLPRMMGVFVKSVEEEGEARHAGILPGDVIVKINDKPTSFVNEVIRIVSLASPGSEIVITIFRAGKTTDLTVTVGESK